MHLSLCSRLPVTLMSASVRAVCARGGPERLEHVAAAPDGADRDADRSEAAPQPEHVHVERVASGRARRASRRGRARRGSRLRRSGRAAPRRGGRRPVATTPNRRPVLRSPSSSSTRRLGRGPASGSIRRLSHSTRARRSASDTGTRTQSSRSSTGAEAGSGPCGPGGRGLPARRNDSRSSRPRRASAPARSP